MEKVGSVHYIILKCSQTSEKQSECLKTMHLHDGKSGTMGNVCGKISFPSVKLLQSAC